MELAKMTRPQKRALLLREWQLCCLANDELYYDYTLALGIEDGAELEDVLADLRDGFYDDDLDDMISLYQRAKRYYGKAGYYIGDLGNSRVIYDEDEALAAAGAYLPERVYKKARR